MRYYKDNFKKKDVTIINQGSNNRRIKTKITKNVFSKQKNNFSEEVNKKIKVNRRYKHSIFRTRIIMKEICPICRKNINDIVFSLSTKIDREDKPVHFDCVFNKIQNKYVLSDKEKIIYKGAGKFMIVDTSSRGENLAFKIVNELDFEKLDKYPEWRKKIFEQVNKDFDINL